MSAKMIYTIHSPDPEKVERVCAEMRVLGAPTIRVVDCADYYMAIEGVHRLAACATLGVTPLLDVLDQDDLVEADSLDWPDLQPGETYPAGELAGEAYSPGSGAYCLDGGLLEPV